MYTTDIDSIISSDSIAKEHFQGVVPSDGMQRLDLPQYFYIVNTQRAGFPGQHWQLVYIKGSTCYFFCSLGRKPRNDVLKFVSQFKRTYYNTTRPQHGSEVTCGGYAILVGSLMARGHSFKSVCRLFDYIKNDDVFIREFLLARYSYKFSK